MKRFRFSLETVLKVRRQVEEVRQRELALAQASRDRALQALGGLENSLRLLLSERAGERKGRLSLAEESWHADRHLSLLQSQGLARAALAEREKVLDLARQRAVEAARERRVLEKLEEKQLQEHQLLMIKEEQGLLDDLAQRAVSAFSRPPIPAEVPLDAAAS
jgi:flagellar FliJ protein